VPEGERRKGRKDGRDVPTGVAIRDPRGQLFEAAERVLLRDGPAAVTSRAVTEEAGVAKGVLHRHFADFDAFLAELALVRIAWIAGQAAALRAAAGAGTVAGNLAAALPDLFNPAVLALVRLVIARDELRTRLRAATGSRLPVISESTAMVSGYLAAERDLGRIAADADIGTLAPMLIATVHLLFTDADGSMPDRGAVARAVSAALSSAASLPPARRTQAGRNRRADHVSSIATCRTGCTPRAVSSAARMSLLRSVPSLPAFGYAIQASLSCRAASIAGAATESSSAWFPANATTASATPGSADGLRSGAATQGTPAAAASAATRWPGLI
jgi:AcrR family transcriptional regulator